MIKDIDKQPLNGLIEHLKGKELKIKQQTSIINDWCGSIVSSDQALKLADVMLSLAIGMMGAHTSEGKVFAVLAEPVHY